MDFILAIDQGTTGTTSVLVDAKNFVFVGKEGVEYPQHYPKPGWVEHDLEDIWQTVETSVTKLLKDANVSAKQIAAIGITNQRETTCAFDKKGNPLARAIVWQDRRTDEYCQKLKRQKLAKTFFQKTGLPIDPYFSGTKMRWLLKNNPKVQVAAKSDDLLFGTIDTFLLHRLTGGASFFTEESNASRTLLMNITSGSWDDELLDALEISEAFLPQIKESFEHFGATNGLGFLPDGIPITGILGDQQAALFGQAGHQKGAMKCTYGTGAFILLNTGENIVYSNNGLLSTVAYNYKDKRFYAIEGSCYIAGAAVQWMRDNLKIIESSPKIEDLARQVKNLDEMEHILFLPFFTGIGSPHWQAQAKAAIVGLTRDSSQSHLARACLDGIALSVDGLVEAIKTDTDVQFDQIKVDGGAVANDLLMQNQATISNLKIIRPKIIETTSYGAALAAAIGFGKIDFKDIELLWNQEGAFSPLPKEKIFYAKKKIQWRDTIEKLYLSDSPS